MAKVVIKSITERGAYVDIEETEVYVDGVLVGSGSYGGEPEDNARYRDYGWVEAVIKNTAKALGADVKIEVVKKEVG